MGSRLLHGLFSTVPETVIVAGSFAPAGAGAPTTVRGKGFTVARSGAGTFVVTLDKFYPQLLSATATLQLATPDDKYAMVSDVSLSAKTVEIVVWDASGAAATDVAANANNRVNFCLVFKNVNS